MKKIMFNDRYGLTEAVLRGRKTMTRRIAYDFRKHSSNKVGKCVLLNNNNLTYKDGEVQVLDDLRSPQYQVGEIVAIAQSYKDAEVIHIPCEDDEFGCYDFPAEQTNGWNNKMFVRADLMPHQIRITNVRVERLQDISDEDCIREGVVKRDHIIPTPAQQIIPQYSPCQYMIDCANKIGWGRFYDTPREAFAVLIDKVSGQGTWGSNPFVFAYEFELVK